MRTSIRTFVGAALALVALSACKKDFLEQDPLSYSRPISSRRPASGMMVSTRDTSMVSSVPSSRMGNPPAVMMTSHRRPSISAPTSCLAIWSCKGGLGYGWFQRQHAYSRISEMGASTMPSGVSATARYLWLIASSAQARVTRRHPK